MKKSISIIALLSFIIFTTVLFSSCTTDEVNVDKPTVNITIVKNGAPVDTIAINLALLDSTSTFTEKYDIEVTTTLPIVVRQIYAHLYDSNDTYIAQIAKNPTTNDEWYNVEIEDNDTILSNELKIDSLSLAKLIQINSTGRIVYTVIYVTDMYQDSIKCELPVIIE